jgi:hypothetical protein
MFSKDVDIVNGMIRTSDGFGKPNPDAGKPCKLEHYATQLPDGTYGVYLGTVRVCVEDTREDAITKVKLLNANIETTDDLYGNFVTGQCEQRFEKKTVDMGMYEVTLSQNNSTYRLKVMANSSNEAKKIIEKRENFGNRIVGKSSVVEKVQLLETLDAEGVSAWKEKIKEKILQLNDLKRRAREYREEGRVDYYENEIAHLYRDLTGGNKPMLVEDSDIDEVIDGFTNELEELEKRKGKTKDANLLECKYCKSTFAHDAMKAKIKRYGKDSNRYYTSKHCPNCGKRVGRIRDANTDVEKIKREINRLQKYANQCRITGDREEYNEVMGEI